LSGYLQSANVWEVRTSGPASEQRLGVITGLWSGRIGVSVRPMAKGSFSKPNGNWLHDHLLSITLFVLFLASWLGQFYFQYQHELDEAASHGEPGMPMFSSEFLHSFWASTMENWQSEFLQVLAFVVLTTYIIHRHSPESRDSDDELAADVKAIRRKLEA